MDSKFKRIRTFEECQDQWNRILAEKIREYKNSDDPQLQLIASEFLEKGFVVHTWPPMGFEFSIDEYSQYIEDAKKILHGWCRTGRKIHEYYQHKSALFAGYYNPREGYYKIIKAPYRDSALENDFASATNYKRAQFRDSNLISTESIFCDCYYNCLDGDDFMEESVIIRLNPLFNTCSHCKNGRVTAMDLKEGQVIHIFEVTLDSGRYRIEWEILKQ